MRRGMPCSSMNCWQSFSSLSSTIVHDPHTLGLSCNEGGIANRYESWQVPEGFHKVTARRHASFWMCRHKSCRLISLIYR